MTSKHILNRVSKRLNIPVSELQSNCRKREYVIARAIFYKLAQENGDSLWGIARVVNVTHATVLHGLKLIREDKIFIQAFEDYGKDNI